MANKAGVSEAPFNNLLSSDIVIRTSDNVDFHLHKAILSIASPFFNDMFTLPQPFPKSEDLTADPIVVSEDSQTMDGLLRLCYPVDDPIMTDLHIVGNILEAATKYLMGQPIKLATIAMQPFVETHPLQVYAIACRLKQEELAGQAAGSWKRQRIVIPGSEDFESTVGGASYIPEMAHISSGAYSRLVKYLLSPKEPAVKPTFQFCENTAISRRGKPHKLETTNSPYYAYMQELMQDADLVVRASDGFDFRVHKLVLDLSSAGSIVKLLDDEFPEYANGLPVVHVDIERQTLGEILRLCYPWNHTELKDISAIRAASLAAGKYNITKVIEEMKRQLLQLAETLPVPVHFLSVELGWMEVAQKAAKYSIALDIEHQYTPTMEHVPADAYYRLIKYHHACRTIITQIVIQHSPTAGLVKWPSGAWLSLLDSSSTTLPGASFPIVWDELFKAQNKKVPCPNPSVSTMTPDVSTTDSNPVGTCVALYNTTWERSTFLQIEIQNKLRKVNIFIECNSSRPFEGQ